MPIRSIDVYLIEYGIKLLALHEQAKSPKWVIGDAIRKNIELWRKEYGDDIATRVRKELLAHIEQRKAKR